MLENRSATTSRPLTARTSNAEPSPFLRSARTNDPLSRFSKNTARGRRVADLVRAAFRKWRRETSAR